MVGLCQRDVARRNPPIKPIIQVLLLYTLFSSLDEGRGELRLLLTQRLRLRLNLLLLSFLFSPYLPSMDMPTHWRVGTALCPYPHLTFTMLSHTIYLHSMLLDEICHQAFILNK